MQRHPIQASATLFVALTVFLSACGGGGDGGGGSTPAAAPQTVVSGAVQAPGGQVAMFREATMWQQMAGLWLSEAMAGISGVSPVPDGTPVQLVRVNDAGNVIATFASTTVSGGRYSFNLTNLGLSFSNNLVVQVINQGTGAQMRAFVVGATVNLDPVSETSVRLVLDQILLTPGTTLSQFTVTELRDIAGAVNQLTTVKQATAGLNIETTVTSIKNLVAAEPGVSSFIAAAAGAGQTTEGPGDIGNYFPLIQGNTWQFQGTHSETGQPTVNFSNTMTVKGSKPVGSVTTTILAESNPLNTGSEEEVYYLKDSRGILNYGNNDPTDTFSPNLVPYRELLFPLNLDVTAEVVNKKGVNFGEDLDLPPDGKNETADILSQVTVEKFEDVTVPKGTFTNTAKVIHKTTIMVFSSAGFGSATVVGTQTVWFAPGVGPVKRTILLQSQNGQSTESTNEELVDYIKSSGPGNLDTGFGNNGVVITPISGGNDWANALGIQSDGKIVVAGISGSGSGSVVARYNSDGNLDAGFGSGGMISSAVIGTMALGFQPDGKIVVAGGSPSGSHYDVAVARYNPNGSIDTSFGSGGMVITPFSNTYDDQARAVSIQSDGKIVVAGYISDSSLSYNFSSPNYDFAVARYNPDGSLDTGFGIGGKVITDLGSNRHDDAYALGIQSDGKIVVAGWSINNPGTCCPNYDFALARYSPDGSLDTSFGTDGKVSTDLGNNYDQAYALGIQSDGKIVVAGSSQGYDFAVARYNTNGNLDMSFGNNGVTITPVGSGNDVARALGIQSDGKIVAAGTSINGSNFDFALVRYTPGGSLDANFSSGGKVISDLGSNNDEAYALGIQSDGKIVVAGRTYNNGNYDIAVVRYWP